MSLRLKPKSYGPLTVSADKAGALSTRSEGGHRVAVGLAPGPDVSSPSDLMLAALGSCIHISTAMAASALDQSISNITVQVNAVKALDLPHRIEQFNVVVSFDVADIDTDTNRILQKTKELCTISNTLGADIELRFEAAR